MRMRQRAARSNQRCRLWDKDKRSMVG